MQRGKMRTNAGERASEPAKLVSLLALATGAVAMPQGAEADIIYQNLGAGVHVGFGATSADRYFFVGLPGNLQFGPTAHISNKYVTASFSKRYKIINLARGNKGTTATANAWIQTSLGNPKLLAKGAAWNAAPGSLATNVASIASSSSHGRFPAGYTAKYVAWMFSGTATGNAPRYGWLELSLSNTGGNGQPDAVLLGYAWDNSGAKVAMGDTQAPEPSSAALLAFGALAFGARGVRKWRRNRVPAGSAGS
jgi:hypothetical protein